MRYTTTRANRGCGDIKAKGCAGCISSKDGGCCVSDGSQEGCSGCSGCSIRGCGPKSSYDWLSDIPEAIGVTKLVEVEFKNGRKGYYLNDKDIDLYKGSIVVVESSPGVDVGVVSLVGKMVELAIRKNRYQPEKAGEVARILREATPYDLTRWKEAQAREHETMIQTRQIASDLKLDMKIGDVEYQGDGHKAIFYYIADARVDFRQLIRILADKFKIRVEMKQIGARQEAGRIGGIGPCGQQLCCSSWMSGFVSVNTNAARVQELSLNPQKLTGMCGKIKCCMNFEVHAYAEAQKTLPAKDVVLETEESNYYHFKTDTFQRAISYSRVANGVMGITTISADRANQIIQMNKKGIKPFSLEFDKEGQKQSDSSTSDILSENSLTRFDRKGKRNGNRGNRNVRRTPNEQSRQAQGERSGTDRPRSNRQGDQSDRSRPPRSARNQENDNENKG